VSAEPNANQTVADGQGAVNTGNANEMLKNLMQGLGDPNKTQNNKDREKTLEELRKYAKDALGRNKDLDLTEFLGATLNGIEKDKTFKGQKRLDTTTSINEETTLSELKKDLDAINKTAGVMQAVIDAKHFDKLLKNSDLKKEVFKDNQATLIDALSVLDSTQVDGADNTKVKLSNQGAGIAVEDAMKKLKPLTDALAEFVSSNTELMGKDETEKFLAMRKTAEKLNNALKSEEDKVKEVVVYAKAIDAFLKKPVKGMDLFAKDKGIEDIKQGEPGKKEVTLLDYLQGLAKDNSVYSRKNANDLAKVQKRVADMESKARTSILKRKGLDGDLKTFVNSNMGRVDKKLDDYMNALRNANFEFDADIGNKAFNKAMEELTAEKIKEKSVDDLQRAFKGSFSKELEKLLSPVKYNIRQFLTYAKEKDKFSGLGEKDMGTRKNLTKVYKDDAVRDLGSWS
jgi:hypothetical protein